MLQIALSLFLFSLPSLVSAAGLVPCGGAGEPECQTCYFVLLIQNSLAWIVAALGIVAVILIIISGLRMVTSRGNVSAKESARRTISNMLIGYILVLSGWMLVDLILKTFVDDATLGVWNEIQCTAQPPVSA